MNKKTHIRNVAMDPVLSKFDLIKYFFEQKENKTNAKYKVLKRKVGHHNNKRG